MDGAARAHHRAASDAHAGSDEDIGRDPYFVFDEDGPVIDVEAGGLDVVAGGAEIGALRNHGVRADVNLAQTVEGDAVADPGLC